MLLNSTMKSAEIVFLLMIANYQENVFATANTKIVWDNDVDVVYPDFDIDMSKGADVRFPNWFFIFPGTKWCGVGDIAENDNDFGPQRDTDKCCRNHDKCDDVILAHETKYNLTNPAFYSRLNCKCDDEFHECLKSVGTRTSSQVGQIYFSALGTKCFKKEKPIKECEKHTFFPLKKCTSYTYQEEGEPIHQWFDVPNY